MADWSLEFTSIRVDELVQADRGAWDRAWQRARGMKKNPQTPRGSQRGEVHKAKGKSRRRMQGVIKR